VMGGRDCYCQKHLTNQGQKLSANAQNCWYLLATMKGREPSAKSKRGEHPAGRRQQGKAASAAGGWQQWPKEQCVVRGDWTS